MSDDLRERVAEIFTKAEYGFPFSKLVGHSRKRMLNSTDAAIALIRNEVLEEAAKVAEEQARAFENESREQKAMGYVAMSKRALQIASYFNMHATAIRALKDAT